MVFVLICIKLCCDKRCHHRRNRENCAVFSGHWRFLW